MRHHSGPGDSNVDGSQRPLVALLASPLLGPSIWAPVAARLRQRGWHVRAVGVGPPPPRTPAEVLSRLLAVLPSDQPLLLVPHSNAGLYVPELIRRRSVSGVGFVDAVLPPSEGTIPVAPPSLVSHGGEKADSDRGLPVWTEWWDPDQLAGLFPSDEVRARVEQEQQRLPLSYFTAAVTVPRGWDTIPAAYLCFGQTYEEERREAERRGWPVTVLAGGHLHMLVDPDVVAGELHRLLTLVDRR